MGSLRCDPDLVVRQLERCVNRGADIDVRAIADEINETAKHGTVRSPNAVLVHRVTKCLEQLRVRSLAHERALGEKREHYARLWVQILRIVSQRQLSPPYIAALLRAARRQGYTDLNPRVADLLLEQGPAWPPEAAAAEPASAQAVGAREGA